MKSLVNWNQVTISQPELDNLLSLNLFTQCSLRICQVLILRKRKYFQSLFFVEFACLFLLITLLFPLNLIILRNFLTISNSIYGLVFIFSLSVAIALSVLLLINYLLWHQAKELKTIAIILEKIVEFNFLVKTFETFGSLDLLKNATNKNFCLSSIDLSDVKSLNNNVETSLNIEGILFATRDSLLQSIKFYNNMYLKTGNKIDVYQLLTNLEHKLIHFVSFPHENNDREYQQILEDIINLGLNVHQELKKREGD